MKGSAVRIRASALSISTNFSEEAGRLNPRAGSRRSAPEELAAVATEFLRAVQGSIRAGVERLGRHVVVELRDSDARGDADVLTVERDRLLGEDAPDLVGRRDRVARTGLGKDEHELLTAVTPEDVRGATRRRDPARRFAQHLVASRVPVPVVDLLEMVEVDHEAGDAAGVALRQPDGRLGLGIDLDTVEQAGEPVARGFLDETVAHGLRAQRRADARHE